MSTDLRDHLQTALSGTYALGRELGGGGMSRVFVADDARLGRRVVVKVLHPEMAAGLSAERFAREVRLVATLQHPCIVPLLAAGDAGGLPFYTMPLVEGESLRERLARGPLPPAEALKVLRDVASALAYAHGRGVAHRDIKPENVLLSGGYAMVADFGIAKALGGALVSQGTADQAPTLTQLGTALGTPAYMAPEQVVGDPAMDHRADIYAFGVLAYELLAGAPPFGGRSAHAILMAHLLESPPPLLRRRPDAPAALADLVMRCLAKDPLDRPQQIADVAAALAREQGMGNRE